MSAVVTVKFPEALDAKQARRIARELKNKSGSESPRVVLDMSRVKEIDLSGLEGLLSCFAELAKQDGGLQVSGISAEAATLLELTRMNGLIQKFAGFTTEAPQFEMAPAAEEIPAEAPVQLPVAV